MNLFTHINIPPQQPKLDYNSSIVLLGSCFAENIGDRFKYFKFRNLVNPFGILFHPKAIETFLWMATQQETYVDSDLFYHNERWHCFDAHSKMSDSEQSVVLDRLNTALSTTAATLQTATHICITLGTAWVYRLTALDMVVANCHKVPQKEFTKELLSVKEIRQSLHNCLHLIQQINPSAKVIFTVSPVRHLKDGFVANNRSKSHLLTAVHQVVDEIASATYFPGYEIVMDELRDYRFFDMDMIHPNELAVEYIWQIFQDCWINPTSLPVMNKVEEVQKALAHRPFNPNSEQHIQFLGKIEMKKKQLQLQYSHIKFP